MNMWKLLELVHIVCLLPASSPATLLSTLYKNEILLCNNGEAVQSIEKAVIRGWKGPDAQFTLHCTPIITCDQTCEWSNECTRKRYGNGVHVVGVNSLYYGPDIDRYMILLCCNGTAEVTNTSCDKLQDYSGKEYKTDKSSDKIWHEAYVSSSPYQKEPFLEVTTCIYNATCIPSTYSSPAEGTDYSAVPYTGLTGLGVGGLLLGSPATAPCSPAYTCDNMNHACFDGGKPITPTPADYDALSLICLADPTCYSFDCFTDSTGTYCETYTGPCLTGWYNPPGVTANFCIRKAEC